MRTPYKCYDENNNDNSYHYNNMITVSWCYVHHEVHHNKYIKGLPPTRESRSDSYSSNQTRMLDHCISDCRQQCLPIVHDVYPGADIVPGGHSMQVVAPAAE